MAATTVMPRRPGSVTRAGTGEARHGTGIVTEAGIVIVAATDVN